MKLKVDNAEFVSTPESEQICSSESTLLEVFRLFYFPNSSHFDQLSLYWLLIMSGPDLQNISRFYHKIVGSWAL